MSKNEWGELIELPCFSRNILKVWSPVCFYIIKFGEVLEKENEVERSYLPRKLSTQCASNGITFLKQSRNKGTCVPWYQSHLVWQTACCVHWAGLRSREQVGMHHLLSQLGTSWAMRECTLLPAAMSLFPSLPCYGDPGLWRALAHFPSRFPRGRQNRRFYLWAVLLGFSAHLLRPFLFKLGMSWRYENWHSQLLCSHSLE